MFLKSLIAYVDIVMVISFGQFTRLTFTHLAPCVDYRVAIGWLFFQGHQSNFCQMSPPNRQRRCSDLTAEAIVQHNPYALCLGLWYPLCAGAGKCYESVLFLKGRMPRKWLGGRVPRSNE